MADVNPLDIACPDCDQKPHKACKDLRLTRGIRFLRKPHPIRVHLAEDAASECACDPDDPCFCFPERFNPPPRYKVQYSARFVEQVRDLGVDKRFPLRVAGKVGQWERNRAGTEARYQEHLRVGPERCGCAMCQRNRGSS